MKLEHLGRYYYAADMLKAGPCGIHLDMGCATGYGVRELLPFSSRVIGLDYNPSLLQSSLPWPGDVDFVAADLDVESLSTCLAPALRGEQLGSVTAFEFFEHLQDARATLLQLGQCLQDEALLLASVPSSRYESGIAPNPHHHVTFGPAEFASLLEECGFRVERVLGQGTLHRIKRRETRLVRKNLFDVRPSALLALHTPEAMRKLALLLAYPDTHDLDFTYSHIFVARYAPAGSPPLDAAR